MRPTTFFLFFVSFCYATHAQQIKLQGRLSIHNSKYNTGKIQYVKAAYLTAPFGGAANSDDSGRFELEFVNLDPGTAISITVEKAGLEVVNARDLQQVVIGRRFPLPVYLTTKGQLAKAQTELYNISKQALYAERDAIIQQLRASEAESRAALAALEERFGQELANRFEAEDLLRQQTEELEKRLPEFALALASENLDFANALYIEAFEYYKQGAIDKAIAVLETARLEQSYEEAKANIAKGEKLMATGKTLRQTGFLQLNQLISNYDLRAKSLLAVFRYHEAAEAYEKIIEIIEENNLENERLDHWLLAASNAYKENGNYTKALDCGKRAIRIREEIYGPGDTLLARAYSYNNIAGVYEGLGDYNKALEYNQKAIAIYKEALGPKHPDLAIFYNDIANVYKNLGDYEKALEYSQKAITIEKEVLDPKHPDLAISYNSIANAYQALGDYEKALQFYQKAIAIQKDVLTPYHPELATYYNNISITYQMLGDNKQALEYIQKALAIDEEVLDPEHPLIATSYNNIAYVYRNLGDYEKALEYYQKAIAIQKEVLGPNHPDLARSYNNIDGVYQDLEDYEKALEYGQKAKAIYKEALGPKHPELGDNYNNIATSYNALGDYEKAMEYYQKAMAIYIEELGPKHPNLAILYNNIATVYQDLEDYEKALEYQQEALSILESVLDSNHPNLGIFYYNIAFTFLKLNNPKKAFNYINMAIAIFDVAYPEDHPAQERAATGLNEILAAMEASKE